MTQLNDCPRITIGFLKRSGMLQHPYPNMLKAKISGIDFFFTCIDRGMLQLTWVDDDGLHRSLIRTHFVFCDPGVHHYFICPVTSNKTHSLYLRDGHFASAQAHGANPRSREFRDARKVQRSLDRLLGANGAPRARGATRRRLLDVLLTQPDLVRGAPVVGAVIEEELLEQQDRVRRNSRLSTRRGANSTEAAIERADHLDAWGQARSREQALRSLRGSYAVERDDGPRSTRPLQLVEDSPALDIRTIAHLRGHEPVWGSSLYWLRSPVNDHERFFVALDMREAEHPHLRIDGYPADLSQPWSQKVQLVKSHPNTPLRWFMICPVSNDRCDVLFYRDRLFASRKVQRLRYASQR